MTVPGKQTPNSSKNAGPTKKTSSPRKKASTAPPTSRAPRKAKSGDPTADQIAEAAYYIWQEKGRPAGQDKEHWHEAEKRLRQGGPRPRATRKKKI